MTVSNTDYKAEIDEISGRNRYREVLTLNRLSGKLEGTSFLRMDENEVFSKIEGQCSKRPENKF